MRSLALGLLVLASIGSSARADSPRVAIVVAGDPAPGLVAAATDLETALTNQGGVTLPADAAVREALRGAEGTADDGLDELRGRRRRLGLTSGGDGATLDLLGEQLELVVVVVVSGVQAPVARVYDVHEHRWFVGEASLDAANREASASFVAARAASAERRRLAPPPEATAAATTATSPTTTAAPPAATESAPTAPRRSFMTRNWPFFVAGALLVGTTTFFLVQRGNRDTTPPVIHIRPGGT